MVFFKIAAKNLGKVKSRTILTILAIALGTALLTGITILNESYLESYLDGVSEQLGYTDIGVKKHLNVSDGYFFINDFEKDSDFEDIDGYLDHTGRIVAEHIAVDQLEQPEEFAYETTFFGLDLKNDEGYGYAEVLEVIDEINKDPEEIEYIEDILKEDSSYIVITTWVEEVYNFKLGEEIYIPHRIDNTTDLDNSSTWETYTVAAIINDFAEGWDVSFDYSLNETHRHHISRAIYVDINQMRDMINLTTNEINLLYIHVDLNKLDSYGQQLLENMEKKNEYYGDNIKAGELERVYDSVQSMMMILIIFTIISFIIAIMLTLNTLMMSVAEQKYEVGVLRAQGIYKKEIFKMFLFEALLLAFLGAFIGILMGMGLSPLLKQLFFKTMMADSTFILKLTFNWRAILLVFAITFSVSLLIGMLPAYFATKIHIIEAIRGVSTGKKGKKIKKLIFPLTGLILTLVGYYILWSSHRDIVMTLIGIIPFIFGLIMLSTVLIPLLSKGFSYIFSFFLGPFRRVTDQNLSRDPKQTKITFIMFGLAIGFLVMISNVLNSIEIVQYNAVPRYIGADIVVHSEGSTFGMDEVLIDDDDIIDGCVENAALINGFRIKVDGYGTWYHEQKGDEPRVTLYIIEPKKFAATVEEIDMLDTDKGFSAKEIFAKLEDDPNTTIVCKQLVDQNHLDKEVGDDIEIDLGGSYKYDVEIIGITEFVSGFSETWEEPSDITPAESSGKYCLFISWDSVIPIIDEIFDWLPDSDLLLKGDDHDLDGWDFPVINRSFVTQKLNDFKSSYGYDFQYAERIWDENRSAVLADSSLNDDELNPSNAVNTHVAFENTSLNGMTEFADARNPSWTTIQEALNDGKNQCVITEDISSDLGLNVEDEVSIWYFNSTGKFTRKNLTIAAIIEMNSTIEAINFHATNPYISGNYDVGEDDTTAVIINIETNASNPNLLMYEDYFNDTGVYEFWIKLINYFDDHLKIVADLQEFLGPNYAFADMRWLFTREYAYAPTWLIQINEDDFSQEEALERVKEFLLMNKMPVISWITVDELRQQYSDQIEFQKGFFNIVLSFALIIAVLGIVINMLISISNRKREIGMMRAIGTYKSELIKMILGETLILVFSGYLIGAIMGSFAANELLLGLPLDTVFDLRLYPDYLTMLFLFGIVIAISIFAAAIPCYKVLKLDVIEALRAI